MPGSPAEADGDGLVALPVDEYLWFVDLALDKMTGIVEELGDDLCNRRPPFRDANSPFVILTHCLGVLEYWAGATVAGRAVRRDRDAEFTASGDMAGLLRRTEHARLRLREDLVALESSTEPLNVREDPADPVPYTETKGAVLVHILEELFEHLGQMEITRDALVAATRR